MNGSRNCTTTFRSDKLTGILRITSGIHNKGSRISQLALHVLHGRQKIPPCLHFEITPLGYRCVLRSRKICGLPCIKAAVEYMDVGVPEEFQEPKEPG